MALVSSPATTKIPDYKTDSKKIGLTGQSSLKTIMPLFCCFLEKFIFCNFSPVTFIFASPVSANVKDWHD